jgi:hypothetical protein
MRGRRFLSVTVTVATLSLAACGGGGGGGGTAPSSGPAPPRAPQRTATVLMSLTIPIRKKSSSLRRTRFVSPGLQSVALYDGSLLIYVANVSLVGVPQFTTVYAAPGAATTVTPGACTITPTTETCAVSLTTTVGQHTFGLIAYPAPSSGTPPSCNVDVCPPVTFNGIISSEGEINVTLNGGPNPPATLTMLGVASGGVIRDPGVPLAYNTPTPVGYQILDSAAAQILTPGDYDNGPVTWAVTPSGVLTIDQSSNSTPPSLPGDQTLTVTCTNAAGGTATITASANAGPNASYASALAYTSANYWGGGALATLNVSCNPM